MSRVKYMQYLYKTHGAEYCSGVPGFESYLTFACVLLCSVVFCRKECITVLICTNVLDLMDDIRVVTDNVVILVAVMGITTFNLSCNVFDFSRIYCVCVCYIAIKQDLIAYSFKWQLFHIHIRNRSQLEVIILRPFNLLK